MSIDHSMQYPPAHNEINDSFLRTGAPKHLVLLNALLAIVYFLVIAFFFDKGNPVLFWLLIAGEIFHVWQVLSFLFNIWETNTGHFQDKQYRPMVDVFITVAGEPVDIVERTARAALGMKYPRFRIHLLNDGFVAKKDNWQDIEELAKRLGINCITRKIPGGAKAGNINNALAETAGELVAVFDADHEPHADFLEKMAPFFADERMGFVQSPQYYRNHELNEVTGAAWEQQKLFFGAICKGKNRHNAVTMCGTNMLIRRRALQEVGGMCTESIAEDFLTGMFMHSRGWKSAYVPEVLAEGLAPEDFLSYFKQQFRWARGALDTVFRYNIFFRRGLTLSQRIEYLSSVSFFFSGVVVLVDALIPIVYLFTGATPFHISTMMLAAVFLPYILVTLYIIQRVSNYSFTFRSIAFSMAGFNIHMSAFLAALLRRRSGFSVTSKRGVQGNFARLVVPQLAYIALFAAALPFGLYREGVSPSLVSNMVWCVINTSVFLVFIRAAIPLGAWSGVSRTVGMQNLEAAKAAITSSSFSKEAEAQQ